MQTHLADWIRDTPRGRDAQEILRKCVHCGFCTATCPTYQLLGDELDGPRGRIYLIKEMLEGKPVSGRTREHLDRCLTCRSCETTCPSGVRYGRLLDIGRAVVQARVGRPLWQRFKRFAIGAVIGERTRFGLVLRAARGARALLPPRLRRAVPPAPAAPGAWPPPRHARRMLALAGVGRAVRPLLPRSLRAALPPAAPAGSWPPARHARRMLVLGGCVQPALAPDINAAAARLLDRFGVSLVEVPAAGCCGALRHHLDDQEGGRRDMRALIDAWWPEVERGAEAIVMTASGCGATVKDYGWLLAAEPGYAAKAQRIAAMTRDLSEVVAGLWKAAPPAAAPGPAERIACHSPCSLQHGQALGGALEALLRQAGYETTPVAEAHLCCGSAGTYSLLQSGLSHQLRERKLAALQRAEPARILTANIGCLHHLGAASTVPVEHWAVALERRLRSAPRASGA